MAEIRYMNVSFSSTLYLWNHDEKHLLCFSDVSFALVTMKT